MIKTHWLAAIICLAFIAGCDDSSGDKGATSKSSSGGPPPPLVTGKKDTSPAATSTDKSSAKAKENADAPIAPLDITPPASTEPQVEREAAGVGSGKKGHFGTSYVEEVASVYFTGRERIIFEAQIPKAMQLFKAANNRPPKDHDEFWKVIIEENEIRLPELPEGERYVYDVKKETLMVEKPKR